MKCPPHILLPPPIDLPQLPEDKAINLSTHETSDLSETDKLKLIPYTDVNHVQPQSMYQSMSKHGFHNLTLNMQKFNFGVPYKIYNEINEYLSYPTHEYGQYTTINNEPDLLTKKLSKLDMITPKITQKTIDHPPKYYKKEYKNIQVNAIGSIMDCDKQYYIIDSDVNFPQIIKNMTYDIYNVAF